MFDSTIKFGPFVNKCGAVIPQGNIVFSKEL